MRIDANLPVDDVMRRWPATIRVFLRRRMACAGCPVGAFHTVADSAAEYGISPGTLLDELCTAAAAKPGSVPDMG